MSKGHRHTEAACILPLLLLIWIAFAGGCAAPVAPPPAPGEDTEEIPSTPHHILRAIRVVDTEIHFDLVRSGSKDVYYSASKAADPLRLVVELPDTVAGDMPSHLAVENEIISKINIMTLQQESDPLTTIEIGLNQDIAYLIDQAPEEIWVTFFADPLLSEAAAARGEPVVYPEDEDSPPETTALQASDNPPTPSPERIVPPKTAEKVLFAPASRILAIQTVEMGENLDVYIIGDGRLDNFDILVLRHPPRLVMDLFGVQSSKVKEDLRLTGPWVKKIRVGQHVDKIRVVFDLIFVPEAGVPHQIVSQDDKLVVSFSSGAGVPRR